MSTNRDLWLSAIRTQKALEEKYIKREIAINITHKVDHPIILTSTSDWHLGSPYTDHEKLFTDLDEITNYSPEYVRVILAGDLIDNFPQKFRSAEAPARAFINPELQRHLLEEIVEEVLEYIDLSTWGNHDVEFDEKNMGFSDVAKFMRKKVPFFHGKGFIVFKIGSQKYTMHISHHLKGSSVYHDLQGPIRAWIETHSDIVVCGHTHSPAYMTDFKGQDERGSVGQRILMKLGTYKMGADTYSDRYFKRGVPGNNTLVLFNDRKKILPFLEFSDAVKYLGIQKKKKVLPKKSC